MTPLTAGECRVLIRLGDGSQFKDIARDFGVSTNTVKTQARRGYHKLKTNNRYGAVASHRRLRDHVCAHLRQELS